MTALQTRTWQFERGELPDGLERTSLLAIIAEELFAIEPDLVRFTAAAHTGGRLDIFTPGYAVPCASQDRLVVMASMVFIVGFSSRIVGE